MSDLTDIDESDIPGLSDEGRHEKRMRQAKRRRQLEQQLDHEIARLEDDRE